MIFMTSALSILICSCGNEFRFTPDTVISIEDGRQRAVADWFSWLFAVPGGFVPKVTESSLGADVLLRYDASLSEAAYRIKVTRRRIRIEASSPFGFFYALQSIRHSLPEDINAVSHADSVEWTIPAMARHDAPSTNCSGLVLDLCYRLVPKENVLHLVESMPDMGIYDLFIVNDGCYTQEELDEIFRCADEYGVDVSSEQLIAENAQTSEDYELVWRDDFREFDGRRWARIPRGEPDWKRYMSSHDSLYDMADGHLILKAMVNDGLAPDDTASYLTGGIYTKDRFNIGYGKVEVRAKLPSARSVWPAIWMMPQKGPWPDAGEIDIMEHLNHDRFVYQTIHSRYATTLKQKDPASYVTVQVNPEKYNIYGVEILPDSLVFRVNGWKTMVYPRLEEGMYAGKTQYPFGEPYYLLIDMQIGGNWVGPASGEDLPAEMKVDWVKVYELKDALED